jgi:hypothetical protein
MGQGICLFLVIDHESFSFGQFGDALAYDEDQKGYHQHAEQHIG